MEEQPGQRISSLLQLTVYLDLRARLPARVKAYIIYKYTVYWLLSDESKEKLVDQMKSWTVQEGYESWAEDDKTELRKG